MWVGYFLFFPEAKQTSKTSRYENRVCRLKPLMGLEVGDVVGAPLGLTCKQPATVCLSSAGFSAGRMT